jgi:hypothetical protein
VEHLFEITRISIETNYDEQSNPMKILKNKIERKKTKKHLIKIKECMKIKIKR